MVYILLIVLFVWGIWGEVRLHYLRGLAIESATVISQLAKQNSKLLDAGIAMEDVINNISDEVHTMHQMVTQNVILTEIVRRRN
jgi:hypothetical protein